MICVTRSPKPAVLVRKEAVWLKRLLQATSPQEARSAASKYRHRQVQDALEKMFHAKCAYCESHMTHVSFAHIEHYRPRSKFPHLTFDWDNLLLSCGVCNSSRYKGDKFPETSEGGPLINPCIDDPKAHFTFHYDSTVLLASIYGATSRGLVTERLLGLNRPELRSHRSKQIQRLAVLAEKATTDPRAQRLLDESRHDDAEYAAFARVL
jgi:uncharacterized protein (TIGR02646 family)